MHQPTWGGTAPCPGQCRGSLRGLHSLVKHANLLKPFHSVWLITATQAVMGLAMGIGVYALLRRHAMADWAATTAAVAVLASAFGSDHHAGRDG
jgi:hypothetical protein